jgi:hypothetical protein
VPPREFFYGVATGAALLAVFVGVKLALRPHETADQREQLLKDGAAIRERFHHVLEHDVAVEIKGVHEIGISGRALSNGPQTVTSVDDLRRILAAIGHGGTAVIAVVDSSGGVPEELRSTYDDVRTALKSEGFRDALSDD